MTALRTDLPALAERAGRPWGVGAWRAVDASAVAAFAEVTGDRQWIHLDADRAATGPFGRPVVHGFLLLALVPALLDGMVRVDGVRYVLNKAVGPARFVAPVPVGDRVRARIAVEQARPRPRGLRQVVWAVEVESESAATTALRTTVTYLYDTGGAAAS